MIFKEYTVNNSCSAVSTAFLATASSVADFVKPNSLPAFSIISALFSVANALILLIGILQLSNPSLTIKSVSSSALYNLVVLLFIVLSWVDIIAMLGSVIASTLILYVPDDTISVFKKLSGEDL